uniref:Uncharacterized protein n=1 Tax=Branchiostoma floridae TaxID=7739 RepID=C3Y846_BRAFL|eukprot:XP_002607505.1 hypothetical protein BRAFLDRAFT_69936 [Branchiostoma floridae]
MWGLLAEGEVDKHISVKETEALRRTLISVQDKVRDKRVDARVDNQTLVRAWENQGGREVLVASFTQERRQRGQSSNIGTTGLQIPDPGAGLEVASNKVGPMGLPPQPVQRCHMGLVIFEVFITKCGIILYLLQDAETTQPVP